jgi:hypothetical protein
VVFFKILNVCFCRRRLWHGSQSMCEESMCEEDVQSERLADEAFGVIVTVFLSVHYAFRPWLLVSFFFFFVHAAKNSGARATAIIILAKDRRLSEIGVKRGK